MEHSRMERRSSAAAAMARSFGMAVAVVAALLLGVVAAAYARAGGEDPAGEGIPAPSDPRIR